MKPCRRCKTTKPLSEFYAAPRMKDGRHSWCKACLNAASIERYKSRRDIDRQVRNANSKQWRAVNGDRKRAYQQKWHEENRESQLQEMWRRRLHRKYGMSPAEYQALSVQQNGRCAVCAEKPKERGLVVDHCHDAGGVRGLLCDACNKGLGFFRDSEQRLLAAVTYLRGRQRKIA